MLNVYYNSVHKQYAIRIYYSTSVQHIIQIMIVYTGGLI